MEISIDKPKVVKVKVELGDLFYLSDEDEFYVFIKNSKSFLVSDGYDYKTVSLSGNGLWSAHELIEEAKDSLVSNVHEGTLIHYPKSKYALKLIRK